MIVKTGFAIVLAVLAPGAVRGAPAKDTSKYMLNPDTFTTSEVCAGCHKDIHAGWSESVHAKSFSSPAFQAGLQDASSRKGGNKAACLSCHAPTTLGAKGADDPLAHEGITCSFCHSIKSAKEKWSMDMFTNEPGQTMRGPFKYAASPGHATEYSPLHKTALLCAGCHQFTNAKGVAVLTTYEEWKAGPWPRQGVNCQDCHMALVPGAVADDIAKPAQESAQDRRLINLHRLVGGSALGQLRRALTATMRRSRREEGSIKLDIDVKNDAAGHKAPTGLPTRSIVLAVEATRDGRSFFHEERVYRRTLLDASGKRITKDADAFSSAARIGTDNRIGPGETRFERFSFPAPPGNAKVVVSLEYVAATGPGGAAPTRTRFQETTVDVP